MMAADNLASYGSLARFRDIERLHKVTDFTVLGASGDMSDFQYVKHLLDSQMYVFFFFLFDLFSFCAFAQEWRPITMDINPP